MTDRQKLIEDAEQKSKQFIEAVDKVRADGVIHSLFPEVWRELQDPLANIPTGTYRTHADNVAYLDAMLTFWKKYLRYLNKEVRAEKHDHHGLHQMLTDLISVTEALKRVATN